MDLTKILAISGKPGLYKMLSQTKAGFIVESLVDGKRFPVFAHERVSTLEEISIFIAGDDDMPLKEVLRKFFDKLEGKPGPAAADGKTLKSFFLETIPAYDQEKAAGNSFGNNQPQKANNIGGPPDAATSEPLAAF